MDNLIILQDEYWTEYEIYCVTNKVVYDNGKEDSINVKVLANGIYEARDIAKNFLLSRKAFLVKSVVGQTAESSSVVIDNSVLKRMTLKN